MSRRDDLAEIARQDAQERRHDTRCGNCGRYVEAEADGFYDKRWPYSDESDVLVFCDLSCADQQRAKDCERYASAPVPRGTIKGES